MASTYLTRQCDATASSGYSSTWTWSGWIKRSKIGEEQGIFQNKKDASVSASRFRMSFGSSDKLLWECKDSSSVDDNSFETNMLFLDTNSWFHIVFSYDSTQGTEANRLKLWVNGVDIRNDGGGFSSINECSSNFGTLWSSASKHFIGYTSNNSGTAFKMNGCMSHVHLTYGTAYPASTFGSTDATTGEWKINTSPSVTYGSQGYFMFKDDNSLNDDSGEGNNFTSGGGTLTKTEDCPSNVFATLNPLTRSGAAVTLEKGNTSKVASSSNSWRSIVSTLGVSTGKYYFEVKMDAINSSDPNNFALGITDYAQTDDQSATNGKFFAFSRGYGYYAGNGKKVNNDQSVANGVAYGSTYTTGDIIGCAFDLDNGKIYFHKNGTYQNSGDPTSGSTGTGSAFNITTGYTYFPVMAQYYSQEQYSFNFGNGYFGTTAVSSAGTNASGNGIFEYDVPAGYTALSTKGLNL